MSLHENPRKVLTGISEFRRGGGTKVHVASARWRRHQWDEASKMSSLAVPKSVVAKPALPQTCLLLPWHPDGYVWGLTLRVCMVHLQCGLFLFHPHCLYSSRYRLWY